MTPHSLLKQPPQRKFTREPPHGAAACTRSTWLNVALIVRMRTTTFATVQQSFENLPEFREPCLRDHLSITTTFSCTVGWSLKAGFTVHVPVYSRSVYATSQRHDLWKWCNRKASEALAGRRPTARWCCFRKLIFVRLPLLPYSWEQLFLDQFAYFFFVLFLWKLSKKRCHRFFYSSPANSGDETKSRYVVKHLFLYVSKYSGRLTFELWNSVATFCR